MTNELLPEGINVLGAPLNENTGKFPLRTREEIETNCNSKGGTPVDKLVVGAMCGARIIQDGFKMNY